MRRLLGLTLMLLLLVSCVQQKSEEVIAPVRTDPIGVEVTVPNTIQVQEAHWRTGSWDLAFEFEHTTALPRVNEGELRLTLERQGPARISRRG